MKKILTFDTLFYGYFLLAYFSGWFLARSFYGAEAPSGSILDKFDVTMLWIFSPITVPSWAIFKFVTFGL